MVFCQKNIWAKESQVTKLLICSIDFTMSKTAGISLTVNMVFTPIPIATLSFKPIHSMFSQMGQHKDGWIKLNSRFLILDEKFPKPGGLE